MRRLLLILVSVLCLAATGCAVNTQFVYRPNAPEQGNTKLPLKVAVLPFKDGTEDFTKRGSWLGTGHVNLAKVGVAGAIDAITPELWARSFAQEMETSGNFQSVRFIFNPSDLIEEDLLIEGVLKKAYWGTTWDTPNEADLYLQAVSAADNKIIWEKEITREWKTPQNIYSGCGMGIQCMADKLHGHFNGVMQSMFAEAREDLLRTVVASSPGRTTGQDGLQALVSAGETQTGQFGGIGIQINVVNNILTVVSPIEGTPAWRAGIRGGDRILNINGEPTAGMTIADAAGKMRGPKGTSVTITVMREGWAAPQDFTLIRDIIRVKTAETPASKSVEDIIERILREK